MSRMTDYMENKLVDMFRGQGLSLPADWYFALASAATDSSITELSGTGYAREALTRSLANFAGTQGAGTTLASSGTSHVTSNNATVDFGTSGSAWGTAAFVVLYDAASSGNAWAYAPLDSSLVIGDGTPVSFAAGRVAFTLGLSGGLSDYLANKLIDLIWRAQAYAWPATLYAGYVTGTAPTNAAAGIEPGVGGYARVAIAYSLTAWAGTQGAGTTTASSGSGGQTSNNAAITFPAPTADQGTASHTQLLDGSGVANLMFWRALDAAKTINAGAAAPFFGPGELTITCA